jgi:hypothetical protein
MILFYTLFWSRHRGTRDRLAALKILVNTAVQTRPVKRRILDVRRYAGADRPSLASIKSLRRFAAMLLLVAGPAHALPPAGKLALQAPRANRAVIDLAVKAAECAARAGAKAASRLTVIDYSRPSTEPRLWVFDLGHGRLLFEEWVAHGKATGNNLARHFSNRLGSRRTSLGLFRTAHTYVGSNGYSLRLHGLEPGVNDRAFERAIVMHGAPYVSTDTVAKLGHLGRSFGCPAVRPAIARRLIDEIRDGQLVFAYYPDRVWIEGSPFLRCDASPAVTARAQTRHTAPLRSRRARARPVPPLDRAPPRGRPGAAADTRLFYLTPAGDRAPLSKTLSRRAPGARVPGGSGRLSGTGQTQVR